MSIWEAILLGLTQGITEFLPVSSSGHLTLLQQVFRVQNPEAMPFFDVMLHVGTLVAVVVTFRKDIWYMIKNPLSKLTLAVVIATVPAVLVTLLFGDFIDKAFGTPWIIGFTFFVTAGVLFITNRFAEGNKEKEQLTPLRAILVGCAQAVAILPGVSRSGSTVGTGLALGFNRNFAAKFSMLMSIPAILGGLVMGLKDVTNQGLPDGMAISILVGTLCAIVAGFLGIRVLLLVVARAKLNRFAWYLVVLGTLVLVDHFVLKVFF